MLRSGEHPKSCPRLLVIAPWRSLWTPTRTCCPACKGPWPSASTSGSRRTPRPTSAPPSGQGTAGGSGGEPFPQLRGIDPTPQPRGLSCNPFATQRRGSAWGKLGSSGVYTRFSSVCIQPGGAARERLVQPSANYESPALPTEPRRRLEEIVAPIAIIRCYVKFSVADSSARWPTLFRSVPSTSISSSITSPV